MKHENAGFTLIEVLIGTTILAMMLALLTSALFAMTRSARAGEARLDETDDVRLVQAFLRRQLSEAVPLTERSDDEQIVLFDGRPEALRFVTHLPAHRGGGGLQIADLRMDERARELVLRYRNAWPEIRFDAPGDEAVWTKQTLVAGVERFRYRYFGNEDDETAAGWRDSWRGADRLPSLIEIELETADGRAWPTIVAAVRSRTAVAQQRLFVLREESAL